MTDLDTSPNAADRLEFLTDSDGCPAACFAWGEVPLETITRDRIVAAAHYAGLDEEDLALEDLGVEALWIREAGGEEWRFCGEAAPGAIRITGIRFA